MGGKASDALIVNRNFLRNKIWEDMLRINLLTNVTNAMLFFAMHLPYKATCFLITHARGVKFVEMFMNIWIVMLKSLMATVQPNKFCLFHYIVRSLLYFCLRGDFRTNNRVKLGKSSQQGGGCLKCYRVFPTLRLENGVYKETFKIIPNLAMFKKCTLFLKYPVLLLSYYIVDTY